MHVRLFLQRYIPKHLWRVLHVDCSGDHDHHRSPDNHNRTDHDHRGPNNHHSRTHHHNHLCPKQLCGNGQELRVCKQRLRRDAQLRNVHITTDMRWRWNSERMRLHSDHMRRAGKELRLHQQRLRRNFELWLVYCSSDMRRRRDCERVRLHANNLFSPGKELRLHKQRLRWHSQLWFMHLP